MNGLFWRSDGAAMIVQSDVNIRVGNKAPVDYFERVLE